MKIDSVDAFYLRLPTVSDIGDGSQDALLVRVTAGGFVGWGECESAPLPTIAALVAPMSHSACHPVLDAVLGADFDSPESVGEIHRKVKAQCIDLLQADHALSGIDIALWDLLGRIEGRPIWSFFGAGNFPKTAYASQLFGDDPSATYEAAREVAGTNFKAAKFGWGPIGSGAPELDRDHVAAAREGLGANIQLLVDTGCIFEHDVERASARIACFEEFNVGWWEEPFYSGAIQEYSRLASRTRIPLAAGEGAHNADQAKHLIDYGGIRFIQVDTGRIGGISSAREVARYARERSVRYVNHTFTSNLALSASLQPCADQEGLAEIPVKTSELAVAIAGASWIPDINGHIWAPSRPGLGLDVDAKAMSPFLQDLEIRWQGQVLWRSSGL
jgi:L-alanine-DL-glutamate epimerase-like enolase superfamily enzyme